MTYAHIILVLLLTGCMAPPHRVEHLTVAGIQVVAHIDTFDAPDACGRSHLHGCHQQINGVHHVWYSHASPPFIPYHEIKGHAAGMSHGKYSLFGRHFCAPVTVGNADYLQGSLVCNDGKKEYFLEPL